MRVNIVVFIVTVLMFGCQNQHDSDASIEDFIPEGSEFIIKIHSFEAFKSAVKNNPLLKLTDLEQVFETHLHPIDSLNISGPMLICMNLDSIKTSYTFITKQKNLAPKSLSKPKFIKDSIWVYSSKTKLENLFKRSANHPFVRLSKITKAKSIFSMYYAPKKESTSTNSIFANILVDVDASPTSLSFNGVYIDSKWNALFENLAPKISNLSEITPDQNQKFKSFMFSDFEQFYKNIRQNDSTLQFAEFDDFLFQTTDEIGSIETLNGTAIALHSLDIRASLEALSGQANVIKSFRSFPMIKFDKDSILKQGFGNILPNIEVSFYTVLDNFIVFSENETILEEIISKYVNKNSLAKSVSYQTIQKALSDEASYIETLSANQLAILSNKLLGTAITSEAVKPFQNSSFQIIKDDNTVHLNGLIQKYRPPSDSKKVTELFSISLDAPIIGNAQFISNHQTKQKDIVAQDIKNQLYLISNQGVVRWKKKISAPILGGVKQIDLFKNGRLQMVFNTENRLYILDRFGRDVGPFPLKFKDEISQPLAVFDYDKNRNYRFLVTQGSDLLMYNGKGKQVKGFSYNSKSKIKTSPKHMRFKSKDYIVFVEGNQLQILNRRGQTRIRVKEPINFSKQEIYFYKNQFSTLNSKGDLVQIDEKGRVSFQSLGFEPGSQMTASNKTLIAQWDNKLHIKNQKVELEYGDFSPPKLFYLKDKIYISTTDLQSKKVWFYDSQGNVMPGFPVYGDSSVDLVNADTDSALEFVCKSGAESLIMYQLY